MGALVHSRIWDLLCALEEEALAWDTSNVFHKCFPCVFCIFCQPYPSTFSFLFCCVLFALLAIELGTLCLPGRWQHHWAKSPALFFPFNIYPCWWFCTYTTLLKCCVWLLFFKTISDFGFLSIAEVTNMSTCGTFVWGRREGRIHCLCSRGSESH